MQPELALEVYEAALKKNPRDGVLASKIGQALVKTHNYNKAISYYDAALKSENQHVMRYIYFVALSVYLKGSVVLYTVITL